MISARTDAIGKPSNSFRSGFAYLADAFLLLFAKASNLQAH